MFEALFIAVQQVLSKPFFKNSATFLNQPMFIIHGHNSIGVVITFQKHIIYEYFISFFYCYTYIQDVAMSNIYDIVRS